MITKTIIAQNPSSGVKWVSMSVAMPDHVEEALQELIDDIVEMLEDRGYEGQVVDS